MANYEVTYCVNPSTGKRCYDESIVTLDKSVVKKLDKAILKLKNGNFGNCDPIKNDFGSAKGMFEAKVDYQKGWRIYYDVHGRNIRVASAGPKSSQRRDVLVARTQLNGGTLSNRIMRSQKR